MVTVAFAPHRSHTTADTPSGESLEDSLFTIPLERARAIPKITRLIEGYECGRRRLRICSAAGCFWVGETCLAALRGTAAQLARRQEQAGAQEHHRAGLGNRRRILGTAATAIAAAAADDIALQHCPLFKARVGVVQLRVEVDEVGRHR